MRHGLKGIQLRGMGRVYRVQGSGGFGFERFRVSGPHIRFGV